MAEIQPSRGLDKHIDDKQILQTKLKVDHHQKETSETKTILKENKTISDVDRSCSNCGSNGFELNRCAGQQSLLMKLTRR